MFIDVVTGHPAYETILTEIFDYGHYLIWYAALVSLDGQRTDHHQIALGSYRSFWRSSASLNGEMAALFELAADTARANGKLQGAIFARQALLKNLLSKGMTKQALQIFTSLPEDERAGFFDEPRKIKHLERRRKVMQGVYEVGNELVAARIYEAGAVDPGARALLQEVRAMEDATLKQSGQSKILQDIADQTLGPNELYDFYLHGVLAEGDQPAYAVLMEALENRDWDEFPAWMFALEASGPHFSWIASARLDEAGLGDIAAHIRTSIRIDELPSSDAGPEPNDTLVPLPDGYGERRAQWGKSIAASLADWKARRGAASDAQATSVVARIALPFQLLVYKPGDLEKLGRGGAPFFPPEVKAIFTRPDGSERYVVWSATWAGGTFLIRCDAADECEMISLEEWIT